MATNHGSGRLVVGAHYGSRDWLGQRATAALIALFTAVVVVQLLLPGELGYYRWAGIFAPQWMKFLTFVVIIALALHASRLLLLLSICCLLYNISVLWFWRLLTYAAVFHFVRQQYGFMRLYSRYEQKKTWVEKIDTITIYTATIYPLLYWHLKGTRNFNWFIQNDFAYLNAGWLLNILTPAYFLLLVICIGSSIYLFVKTGIFNIPKFTITAGTVVSWYFGIVYFNGDMAFTLLNVVSHGVPYMALVWIHGNKNKGIAVKANKLLSLVFSYRGLVVFLLIVFGLAFMEEFLWDICVWDEHRSVFGGNSRLIERMEKDGYVGTPDHVGRREVLIDPDGNRI